jgi:hypothetical protein
VTPPFTSTFGRDYREALFALSPTPAALRLAWVLLDEAFRRRSRVFELGYVLVRELTLLDGRTVERARDWLVDRQLLEVYSTPRVRTEWVLLEPPTLTALVRSHDLTAAARSHADRTSDRTCDRTCDRASAVALPGPGPLPLRNAGARAGAHARAGEAAHARMKNRQ